MQRLRLSLPVPESSRNDLRRSLIRSPIVFMKVILIWFD